MGAERCPQCGAKLPREARFCAYCGVSTQVAFAPTPARDERRVITALFADIAGSTQLGERLDPEDFRDLTDGALSRMGSVIEELGGRVRGTAGDGILGLFGAPTAHEDDAERAVVAGLRLVAALRSYGLDAAERWGVGDFRVRVGIETGLAVVGEVRAGSHVQYDASGDCLNTAARLEGAADVDGVLVGPMTHRLLEEVFHWGEPRPLALKGKANPVLARHAVSVRSDRAQRSSGPGSGMVGRDGELDAAGKAVADVFAGRPRTIFVTGAAGIGKSRFISEIRSVFVADRGGGRTATWLEGGCLSYGMDEPYLPFRQIVRQAIDEQPTQQIAPMLAMVLGLPLDASDAARIATLSAESLQLAVIESFANVVRGLAAHGPVAIAVDDLHWADAASLQLAEALISQGWAESPVLLVLGTRSETDRPVWALRGRTLEIHPEAEEVGLCALDGEAERRLVANLVGEGTLPTELETRLLQRAEGNPFYLGELLRSLHDAGAIVKTPTGWRFDHTVGVELPDTVERVVLARIDRLPSTDRDLLDSAAVVGREFDLQLLSRMVGTNVTPDSLANLVQLGLFEEASGALFRFSHPLIQETTYSSMVRRTRKALHGRAAAAIEELDDGDHHAVLARHHGAAGHAAEAITHHRLAAIDALRIVASGEALSHLDLAIAAAASLDESAVRGQLPELHLLRGRARGRLGDYVGGIADLRQSLDGAQAVDDRETEMGALNDLGWLLRAHNYEESISHHRRALNIAEELDDAGTQVTALSRMSMVELNRLRLDRGLELADRALVIARAAGRDELLGAALDCLKLAALHVGDLELLERTVAEIIEVQERTGDLYLLQWAHLESATVPLARGDLDSARSRVAVAQEINSRFVADPVAAAMMLEASSWIDRAEGQPAAAVAAVRAAVAVIGTVTTPEWSAWLEASLGSHLIEQGNVGEAITVLESALLHAEAIESANRAFRAASHLAFARQLDGDDDGSRTALKRARDILGTITTMAGDVFLDGYHSYLAIARTCLALDDPRGAREVLVPLLAAARRNGWRDATREASELLDAVTSAQ